MERGFEADFMRANSYIHDRILAHDWGVLAIPDRKANSSLVKEFFAEVSVTSGTVVRVRGHWVHYDSRTINRVLGLRTPTSCAFTSFLKKTTEDDVEKVGKVIATEGKTWRIEKKRLCMPMSHLTTEAAIWYCFLRNTIWPTSHDNTISKDKCCLLYCILTNQPINVGNLMHFTLDQTRTKKKMEIPLPCLVTALLTDAGVPSAPGDIWMKAASPISLITLKKMGRFTDEDLEGEDEEGTEVPVINHPTAAGSSRGTLTQGPILTMLKKINDRLQTMEDRMRGIEQSTESVWAYTQSQDLLLKKFLATNNAELAAAFPSFPPGICPTLDQEDTYQEEPTVNSPEGHPNTASERTVAPKP